jgi:hypothetical protein
MNKDRNVHLINRSTRQDDIERKSEFVANHNPNGDSVYGQHTATNPRHKGVRSMFYTIIDPDGMRSATSLSG